MKSLAKNHPSFPDEQAALQDLRRIPGVGKSISWNLLNIGIRSVRDLKGKDPEVMYKLSNFMEGTVQDRCLLYVFRCAVYFAESRQPDREKLQWWYWKDTH